MVHFCISSFLSFCFFFSLWVRGRDYLAHITVCTSALSLIWHQVRPPVCEGRQPLASWACNPTDPYPDWHGLFTLVTSIETFNALLSLSFSLSFTFLSQYTLSFFHLFNYPLPSLSVTVCHISFPSHELIPPPFVLMFTWCRYAPNKHEKMCLTTWYNYVFCLGWDTEENQAKLQSKGMVFHCAFISASVC